MVAIAEALTAVRRGKVAMAAVSVETVAGVATGVVRTAEVEMDVEAMAAAKVGAVMAAGVGVGGRRELGSGVVQMVVAELVMGTVGVSSGMPKVGDAKGASRVVEVCMVAVAEAAAVATARARTAMVEVAWVVVQLEVDARAVEGMARVAQALVAEAGWAAAATEVNKVM